MFSFKELNAKKLVLRYRVHKVNNRKKISKQCSANIDFLRHPEVVNEGWWFVRRKSQRKQEYATVSQNKAEYAVKIETIVQGNQHPLHISNDDEYINILEIQNVEILYIFEIPTSDVLFRRRALPRLPPEKWKWLDPYIRRTIKNTMVETTDEVLGLLNNLSETIGPEILNLAGVEYAYSGET